LHNHLKTIAAIILTRLDLILEEMGKEKSLDKFPILYSLMTSLNEEDIREWSEKGENDDNGYTKAVKRLNNDNVLRSLLDLSIAVFYYPEADAFLTHNFGHGVNLKLAFLLEGISFPEERDVIEKAEKAKSIFSFDDKAFPLCYSPVSIDEKTVFFLNDENMVNPLLSDFTEYYGAGKTEERSIVNSGLVDEGLSFFKAGGRTAQISGHGGRRFIARRIADGLNKDFLFINLRDFLHEAGKNEFQKYKGALLREAELDDAGICFFGIDKPFLSEDRELIRDLALLERLLFRPVNDRNIPLILCTDHNRALLSLSDPGDFRNLRLPGDLKLDDRRKLWEEVLKGSGSSLDPDELSLRYRLNASEISAVWKSFIEVRGNSDNEDDDNELLTRVSIEELMKGEEAVLGRVIYPDIRLDDVKVKPRIKTILNDVISSVRSSSVILDRWNLSRNYPYGRSVSLLISGPPGTGKTMTANAIAGELSLALYQVNLSNIVDKYIGETEKNLEKVFNYAEKSNTVLFFDEADALFGTRSEVHDSRDRYANTEISYLLQRIEAYDGIVIMATNIKGNIDPAFMRRIRYVVHFENPDEEMRRAIWESLFTDSVPHEEDIDFDYLSTQFDSFTGSIIKTVFLNACAKASGNEEILGMKHLVSAVRHELEKGSAVGFSMDTLGKYAYLC